MQLPPTPPSSRMRRLADGADIVLHSETTKPQQTFLQVGSTLGKYRILAEVDRGGMAVVYRALQTDLEREVALKVLPTTISINPHMLERFLAEAHAVSRLSHKNIVAIHEVSTEGSIHYIAMDYIPGKNLYYYLNENKPKVVEVLDIVAQLAEALAYAHGQRIIHRDLKLNNVIMKDNRTPVVIDFGLAKALEDDRGSITRTGELVGSPAYMAPERILGGRVDRRADICSLGIMLYEMLTFKNPYLDQRSLHQTTLNVMEASPLPPSKLVPWLPSEVEAITLKAMQGDPAKRYQSMDEMRDDIQRYQRGEFVHAQPPSLTSRLRHVVRRYWPYMAIGGLALLFSGALGLLYYQQSRRGKPHWQVLYQDRFTSHGLAADWTVVPLPTDAAAAAAGDTARWSTADGTLTPTGLFPVCLRLTLPITRDARVEFDLAAPQRSLHDVTVFLYGNRPDSGCQFRLFRGGSAEHGITMPGGPLLLCEDNQLAMPPGGRHHVVVERRQSLLTLRVDDVLVARAYDLFPALGDRHQNLGLLAASRGSSFDNLRISQLATPLAPGPTQVADRFWERGDFQAGLEEYRSLSQELTDGDLARHVRLRIADCLIRLGRSSEALEQLNRGTLARVGPDAVQAEALFLLAMAHHSLGQRAPSDSILSLILSRFPTTAASQSAMVELAQRLAADVDAPSLASLEARLDTLAARHPRCAPLFSRVHVMLVERYLERGMTDRAVQWARRGERLFADNEVGSARAQTALAHALLCRRESKTAVDVITSCVARHGVSQPVFEAWMLLAAAYEYDLDFPDAFTIYRKVWRECPRGVALPWMARVKMAELAHHTASDESGESMLAEVDSSNHPFALPRMVAQLYRGAIGETGFTDAWHGFYPDDWYFLYYLARRALLGGERVVAGIYLNQLLQYLPPGSLRYVQVYQMLSDLDRF